MKEIPKDLQWIEFIKRQNYFSYKIETQKNTKISEIFDYIF